MTTLQYRISAKRPETHLFDVQCVIPKPDPKGQRFFLPAWIPGSYLIRDFSKYLINLRAFCHEKEIKITSLDKNTWECEPVQGALTLSYQVFAFDLTPRGAHVDTTHAFFNGSRVFVCIEGHENEACLVDILPPEASHFHHWKVATSMPSFQVDPLGFGRYAVTDYDTLIDHPVEIGNFKKYVFEVENIPHELIITGHASGDMDRLIHDISRITEYQCRLFGKPYPFGRYVFLLTVLPEGYGGIEHRNSSCLQISPLCFPQMGEEDVSSNYCNLLSLISHEYFHAWNVKRIKPEAFLPYNLKQENYTKNLWIFEGITSYYDELSLIRSGLINITTYLELIGKLMTQVYNTPGRLNQTLEAASFDAWTKFYQPHENSLNANISYYTKGALVALALDLCLRQETLGKHSLDTMMQALWLHYGQKDIGLPETGFETLIQEITGLSFSSFFDKALRDVEDLPLELLLNNMGVQVQWQNCKSIQDLDGGYLQSSTQSSTETPKPILEVKLKLNTSNNSNSDEAEIAAVFANSAAEAAGLAPNDIIIAVNGFRVNKSQLPSVIARFNAGDKIIIHFFRRKELMTTEVILQAGWLKAAVLSLDPNISDSKRRLLSHWLGHHIREYASSLV